MTQRVDRLADVDGPGDEDLLGFGELKSIEALDADAAPNPVDMVVFDIGNVLLTWDPMRALSEGVGSEAAKEFLTDPGVDFVRRNLEADAGRPWAEIVAEISEQYPRHAAAAQSYVDNFALAIAEPIEGSVAILKELHEADVPLFAVTNFSAELFGVAEAHHDFLDLFEEIVISGEERVVKPHPEIWEILEEVTRHVGGLSDAVFIDDSPTNVMGAEQAGIDSICFTDPESLREELRLRGLPLRAVN